MLRFAGPFFDSLNWKVNIEIRILACNYKSISPYLPNLIEPLSVKAGQGEHEVGVLL